MANRRLFQFLYSKQPKLTCISTQVTFRNLGRVVGSATGQGIYSVVGYGNGQFQIKLADNYVNFVGADFTPLSGITGTDVNVASLVGSSTYQVAVVGNSDWSTNGFDTDYNPVAVGDIFVANAVAGSGTGTAKLLIPSNLSTVEIMNGTGNMMTNAAPNFQTATGQTGKGAAVYFQTLAPSSTTTQTSTAVYVTTTTMVATNPVASSSMFINLWFRDSSALPGN